ncbi:VOC family protein [Micromonospora sp. NPDC050397]|uniref:VOC family protein n=1 Tax=Micromonospora sp. NPDC050397 TaxID=3364279 RepID=UPI00384E4DE7
MSKTDVRGGGTGETTVQNVDMKIEVAVIPVSDVERAKEFYRRLGWRLDQTPVGIVQLTPHGSGCSVQFGANLTSAAPGSASQYVIVNDLETTRNVLLAAGVEVGGIFHLGPDGPLDGPDPERRSYFSRASFSDPDGNQWLLQEVTTRLPGRIEGGVTSFGSVDDLTSALERASAAHGEHEKRTGAEDPNWANWYAAYMVSEQSGAELPR